MSIATTTDVGIAGGLKQYYQRVREDVFPLLTPMFAQFTKMKKGGPRNMQWGGQGINFNVVVADAVGQNMSAAGYLPRSNFRKSVQANVGIARGYVRQQFDSLVVTATRNSQSAFITLGQQIDEEVRLKSQLMIQENAHGDGRGVKAIVSNVVNQSTFDIISPYGIAGGGQGALWVAVGGSYTFRDTTGVTLRAGGPQLCATVALQTAPDTYRVTFPTTFTGVVVGDLLVGATANDDAYNGYANGLTNITNRGAAFNSLHGITPATAGQERWNSTRMIAGTDTARIDQITESDFLEVALRLRARSGEDPTMNPDEFIIVTTPGLAKGYVESMVGQRVVNLDQTRKLNGGYTAAGQWMNIPIIADNYCPVGTVYMLHMSTLGWANGEDFGAVQYEDSDAFRFVADRDAYETSFKIYYNILTTKRNAQAICSGFTEAYRYSPLAF